jgi:hypothetical protein
MILDFRLENERTMSYLSLYGRINTKCPLSIAGTRTREVSRRVADQYFTYAGTFNCLDAREPVSTWHNLLERSEYRSFNRCGAREPLSTPISSYIYGTTDLFQSLCREPAQSQISWLIAPDLVAHVEINHQSILFHLL